MNKLFNGDCIEVLKTLKENSVDSIVTDPPYELGFMGKSWDSTGIANNKEMWAECLRVLKPGGHLLAFSGTRTYHRMASAIEDAGFEVRDMIEWVYGCLSEDTEILTSNGWKMLYSVFEGDYVFACNYKNDLKLQLEKVKKKYIYDYNEDAYHIKDTGYYNSELMETDHIVSKNHNVLVSESWARDCYSNGEYPQKVFAEVLYENVQKRKELGYKSEFHIPGLNGFIPCTIEKIHYKGKVWCVEVESGAFVARRNGKVFITGNSGFPKSLNIGKAVDKLQGNRGLNKEKDIEFIKWLRNGLGEHKIVEIDEILGTKAQAFHYFALSNSNRQIPTGESYKKIKKFLKLSDEYDNYVKEKNLELSEIREVKGYEKAIKTWNKPYLKPTLGGAVFEEAKQWEGWGSQLKPAHEPICMARKPLEAKTVAENVLKWGTGGINIDESRVESNEELGRNNNARTEGTSYVVQKETMRINNSNGKRFPANLIHDNSDEVRECFPKNIKGEIGRAGRKSGGNYEASSYKVGVVTETGFKDNGNASRFFKSIIYQAKASKSERNEGCENLDDKLLARSGGAQRAENEGEEQYLQEHIGLNRITKMKNNHPTVKPIALMEYLIKMVTKEGGVVLDPFTGSGSTLIAAKKNGFSYIGIELEKDYCEISEARLKNIESTRQITLL